MKTILRAPFFYLLLGEIFLGDALQAANGRFSPSAIADLAVASVCACLALVFWREPARALGSVSPARVAELMLSVAALYAWHWFAAPTRQPIPSQRLPALALIALTVVIAVASLRHARWAFFALVALFVAAGFRRLLLSPPPWIDVFVFHQHAWETLRAHASPYGGSIPNIYHQLRYYSPAFANEQTVFVGFPYPPLSLLLSLPALALGDARYATLLAWAGAAILIALTKPTRVALLAGTLLPAFPRALYVVECAWTEPFVVLLLAFTLFVRARAPKFLGVAFGLFLAVKQYDVLILPLFILLQPKRTHWWHAFATAALVTLPLALTNLAGFWHDVVAFQFAQPFRDESLSFTNLLHWRAAWPAFVSLPITLWLALRLPKDARGFAFGAAFVWFWFFALNKQAFCNYYALVLGALCLSLSAFFDLWRASDSTFLPSPLFFESAKTKATSGAPSAST